MNNIKAEAIEKLVVPTSLRSVVASTTFYMLLQQGSNAIFCTKKHYTLSLQFFRCLGPG